MTVVFVNTPLLATVKQMIYFFVIESTHFSDWKDHEESKTETLDEPVTLFVAASVWKYVIQWAG